MELDLFSFTFLYQSVKFRTAGWLCAGYAPLWPSVVAKSFVSLSPLDMGTSAVPKFGSLPSLLLVLWCSVWPRCFSALVRPVFGIKHSPALQWALSFRNSRLASVYHRFSLSQKLPSCSHVSCFVLAVSVELIYYYFLILLSNGVLDVNNIIWN